MNTVKCDYCDNEAVNAAIDPYEQELSDHPELVKESHFVCSNQECIQKFEEALFESAMDV